MDHKNLVQMPFLTFKFYVIIYHRNDYFPDEGRRCSCICEWGSDYYFCHKMLGDCVQVHSCGFKVVMVGLGRNFSVRNYSLFKCKFKPFSIFCSFNCFIGHNKPILSDKILEQEFTHLQSSRLYRCWNQPTCCDDNQEKAYRTAENLQSPRRSTGQHNEFISKLGNDWVQHHGGLQVELPLRWTELNIKDDVIETQRHEVTAATNQVISHNISSDYQCHLNKDLKEETFSTPSLYNIWMYCLRSLTVGHKGLYSDLIQHESFMQARRWQWPKTRRTQLTTLSTHFC